MHIILFLNIMLALYTKRSSQEIKSLHYIINKSHLENIPSLFTIFNISSMSGFSTCSFHRLRNSNGRCLAAYLEAILSEQSVNNPYRIMLSEILNIKWGCVLTINTILITTLFSL